MPAYWIVRWYCCAVIAVCRGQLPSTAWWTTISRFSALHKHRYRVATQLPSRCSSVSRRTRRQTVPTMHPQHLFLSFFALFYTLRVASIRFVIMLTVKESICWLQTGRQRFDPRQRQMIFFLYPVCPDRLWGPPSLLYNLYRGSFLRG
jgi:hypothetical protein